MNRNLLWIRTARLGRQSLGGSCLVAGFTLVELLVTIAVVGVLAGLLMAGVIKGESQADQVGCLNNARQIHLAWTLYVNDRNGNLVPYVDGLLGGFTNCVAGHMSEQSDATNTTLLTDGRRLLLSVYLREPGTFKCPGGKSAHVRSISMNCRLNPTRYFGVPPRWVGGAISRYRTFRTLADIGRPAEVFVTADEYPKSIDDPYFAVDMSDTGRSDGVCVAHPFYMIDYPASSHSGGATFAFADGHIVIRKWIDPRTLESRSTGRHIPAPNGDIEWLQAHTTYLK